MLQRDAGPAAANLFASFLRGAPMVPPSAAFGPCFARVPCCIALIDGEQGSRTASSNPMRDLEG